MDSKNIKYLLLSIILLILSIIGIFFIFNFDNLSFFSSGNEISVNTPSPLPSKKVNPTVTPTSSITITPVASSTAKIASSSPTPTKKITPTPTTTPSLKVTSTPTIKTTPTSTPIPSREITLIKYQNTIDGFFVEHDSTRKFYQDIEATGNRYTFYSPKGNFAVHVSASGTWSWINPDRNFSAVLLISGKNTYRYDIATQTIVDLQAATKNYTLQCVHNGNSELKTECEKFIRSFTLL